ncbi:bZIP transcription factor 60, partial [Tanacetum coccineum]
IGVIVVVYMRSEVVNRSEEVVNRSEEVVNRSEKVVIKHRYPRWQLRNKDAALRSRERKKSYVKELEMKSKYYEEECRRLESVLQCFMAENQALRFSLHSSNLTSNTTSITKQESVVLFLAARLSKSTSGGNCGRRKTSSKLGTQEGAK